MGLLIVAFIAGVLTILSPCVLPLLPVIIGGSLTDKNPWRPFILTASLSVSVVAFTLLIKWSADQLGLSQEFWKTVSGIIILVFGIFIIFPKFWEKISNKLKFGSGSHSLMHKAGEKKNVSGTILMGAALGPVFTSCSPTYFVILATVLPASFIKGLLYLSVYVLGLAFILFFIAFFGQKAIAKMKWAADPKGWFKKVLGILFLVVGIAVIFGLDKKFETFLWDNGYFDITRVEQKILNKVESE